VLFDASLMHGDGLNPAVEPRPVVKEITAAASFPGVSMNTKPLRSMRSAYS
jgi:hypothetical protein